MHVMPHDQYYFYQTVGQCIFISFRLQNIWKQTVEYIQYIQYNLKKQMVSVYVAPHVLLMY